MNKKLMRNVFIAVAVVVGIALLGCSLYTYVCWDENHANLKQVKQEVVEELALEDADDENYSEYKAQFAEKLLEKEGKKAEKTVFFVYGSRKNYKVAIYYKIDEVWYTTTKGCFSSWISNDFDHAVLTGSDII